MLRLAQRVRTEIRREDLLRPGDRVGVAVSGGIDSVALLLLLLELRHDLGVVLSVVHFNHKLRGAESDADEKFVADLAQMHRLQFFCDRAEAARSAVDRQSGLEAEARELRYEFFGNLLREDVPKAEATESPQTSRDAILNKIVTGHNLDDQAETVLMRLIRGTGLRGLGGIYPRLVMEDGTDDLFGNGYCGEVIRPLLSIRRSALEQYLRDRNQAWREDSTNADTSFMRNRVRKLVLPLLEREFNPAAAERLGELSEIARGEEDYWSTEASGWLGTVVQWFSPDGSGSVKDTDSNRDSLVQISPQNSASLPQERESGGTGEPQPTAMNASVSRMWLLAEPIAVQRRVVKAIGKFAGIPLDFKHIEEILRSAADDAAHREVALPLGWTAVRGSDELLFLTPGFSKQERISQDYEYELTIPGRAVVLETGSVFEASLASQETESPGYNLQHLLDAELVCGKLRVRNWRPGDRFWPAHCKSPKKIKELLQDQHIRGFDRKVWPVVMNETEIVWVRGLPVPTRLRAEPGREAVLIREISLGSEESAL